MGTVSFDVAPPGKPTRWSVAMDSGGHFEGEIGYNADGGGLIQPPTNGWPRGYPEGSIKVLVKTALRAQFSVM